MENQSPRLNAVQIGIILTALATALIHFSLLFPDLLFILNGLGYLSLLAACAQPMVTGCFASTDLTSRQ